MDSIKNIWRAFRTLQRRTRNLYWRASRGRFAGRLVPFSGAHPPGFPHAAAQYACPIICPPGQAPLFENKLHNLHLAASRMRGLVLGPGEIFSFWRLAGVPDEKRGYKEGATFIRHKVSSALGGGLCQLSGLIHNLALLAGLTLLERHEHSIDAYGEGRYIPLGRDATVAYPRADLCFQNPYDFPLVLGLEITREAARGWFHSPRPLPFEVELVVSEPLFIKSPVLPCPPGGKVRPEKGLDGKKVESWRVFRSPGGTRKEFLFGSFYRPTPTFVADPGGMEP